MIDFASFGWPQWLVLAWYVFSMAASASKSGQYVKVSGAGSIIVVILIVLTLTWGGFFSPRA